MDGSVSCGMTLEVACGNSSTIHNLLKPVRNGSGMNWVALCVGSDQQLIVLGLCSPLDCSGGVGYHACYQVQLRVLRICVKSIICAVVSHCKCPHCTRCESDYIIIMRSYQHTTTKKKPHANPKCKNPYISIVMINGPRLP